MTITIMYNPVTGRYTLVMLQDSLRATVDTIYLAQISNLITLIKTAYKIRLVFHNSILPEKKEEIVNALRSMAV